MTTGTELRYVSLSQYHYNTHLVVGHWMVTLCGKALDGRHVERMHNRVTCKVCQGLRDAEQGPGKER
jgi:hypothetical protein